MAQCVVASHDPDDDLLRDILVRAADLAGICIRKLPQGIRMRRFGDKMVYVNYSRTAQDISRLIASETILLGGSGPIPPAGVIITSPG